jgi:hypothetical protein
MHNAYQDIRTRISEPPLWWDEYAVPRYVPFTPREVGNIYAREVVLLEIACQACSTRYHVAMSFDMIQHALGRASLADRINDGSIHYGDPPNACPAPCLAGASMNCFDLRVVEFWRRERLDWIRDPALERVLPDITDLESED